MRRIDPMESRSPFDVLADAFALLVAEPHPLAVHGAEIGHGLPARPIPLDELRARLLHPACRYAARDAALNLLLVHAQADGGAWVVGLAGVLLPGLRSAATPLLRACPQQRDDVEAEMLAGLVTAIQRALPDRPRPAAHLVWKARRAAEHSVLAELAERARTTHHAISAEPPLPYGHPDLVLAEAVASDVISGEDAELIGATRLGEMSLANAAQTWGCSYTAVRLRRWRAECALVAWIEYGCDEFEAKRREGPGSTGVGRPRQGRPLGRRPGLCQQPDSQTHLKEVSRCPDGRAGASARPTPLESRRR